VQPQLLLPLKQQPHRLQLLHVHQTQQLHALSLPFGCEGLRLQQRQSSGCCCCWHHNSCKADSAR
jgi:hypothetical protein